MLNNDIAAGEFLYRENDGVRILDFEGKEYNYSLGKDFIIRQVGSAKDTFLLKTVEVNYNEMKGTSVSKRLLDKLEMVIIVNGAENTLSFHKQYGADLLMLAEGGNQ